MSIYLTFNRPIFEVHHQKKSSWNNRFHVPFLINFYTCLFNNNKVITSPLKNTNYIIPLLTFNNNILLLTGIKSGIIDQAVEFSKPKDTSPISWTKSSF